MNKQDRAKLTKATTLIEEAKAILEEVGEGEQEKFDNLTEGLQASERGQKMEEAVLGLADAASTLVDIVASIEQAAE